MFGSPRRPSQLYWLILGFLLVATIAKHAATLATGPTLLEYDAIDYWERGTFISQGDWLQQERAVNYRGPLYPYFLGACQSVFGSYALLAAAIFQHTAQILAGLLAAIICWWISQNRTTVVVAYTLSTLSITAPWYANVMLTESMFQLAMTIVLATIVAFQLSPSRNNAIRCGYAQGIATLTRPIPKLLWLPLGLLWWISYRVQGQGKMMFVRLLWLGLGVLVVTGPWMMRNRFLFETSSVAKVPPINKWVVCFHPGSAGDLPIPNSDAGDELRRLIPDIDTNHELRRDGYAVLRRLESRQQSSAQIDALTTRVCLDSIAANWPRFFWQTFKRFGNFWRCSVKEYPFYSAYAGPALPAVAGQNGWRFEPVASWYETILRRSPSTQLRWMELDSLVCALGILLMILRPQTRAIGLSLATIFLYFAAITAALEVENYRYRMVLDPCLIVAIACGFASRRNTDRIDTSN